LLVALCHDHRLTNNAGYGVTANVVDRGSQFIVEWAEYDEAPHPVEETVSDDELARYVRLRIDGTVRQPSSPAEAADPDAMVGEPLF
jgi:hypothetical protein